MAKALVVTGTHSSAGKSLLVTALCRLFKKAGLKVAPFKAQNMSLQSFVCRDGAEIGLAQALQAFACKLEPESSFNPILLKPEGDNKSQVLLMGKFYKRLSASDYYQERDFLWEKVKSVLNTLRNTFDCLILEGAGSPAEINLLSVDLVNIKPALYLQAPVLLVGDIDKGGAFASLFGTYKLLEHYLPNYVKLIKGFVINKFRGDLEILRPAIKELEGLLSIDCLGVLPYFENLALSDEDGFSFFNKKKGSNPFGDIKVVILPLRHISNFSDFDPFYLEEDVELIYSLRQEDILSADIIILPGSKNTLADLQRLLSFGVKEALQKALNRGAELIGICGGYQMLGEVLRNPYQVEGELKEIRGLGFLEMETIFYPEKITTQALARPLGEFYVDGELWGYEIHKGISHGGNPLFEIKRLANGEVVKEGQIKGKVWGTYLHGIFTNDSFRRELLNKHRIKKGLNPLPVKKKYWEVVEMALEELAHHVERYLNMEKLFKILGF